MSFVICRTQKGYKYILPKKKYAAFLAADPSRKGQRQFLIFDERRQWNLYYVDDFIPAPQDKGGENDR